MKILGLQKLTLLDYPGRVACTVFLGGCNFRCPYCHNSELLDGTAEPLMDDTALLSFLETRRGILDGVCITGGEPTLQPQLPQLLRSIKAMGYPIKLDTNGYRPDVLKALVEEGLVDYVAMDVKNGPERYAETVGLAQIDLERIEESLRYLIGGAVDYELRTTVVREFHDAESVARMGQWIGSVVSGKKPAKLYLQSFVDRDSVAFSGLNPPLSGEMARYAELLSPFCEQVSIRGE